MLQASAARSAASASAARSGQATAGRSGSSQALNPIQPSARPGQLQQPRSPRRESPSPWEPYAGPLHTSECISKPSSHQLHTTTSNRCSAQARPHPPAAAQQRRTFKLTQARERKVRAEWRQQHSRCCLPLWLAHATADLDSRSPSSRCSCLQRRLRLSRQLALFVLCRSYFLSSRRIPPFSCCWMLAARGSYLRLLLERRRKVKKERERDQYTTLAARQRKRDKEDRLTIDECEEKATPHNVNVDVTSSSHGQSSRSAAAAGCMMRGESSNREGLELEQSGACILSFEVDGHKQQLQA